MEPSPAVRSSPFHDYAVGLSPLEPGLLRNLSPYLPTMFEADLLVAPRPEPSRERLVRQLAFARQAGVAAGPASVRCNCRKSACLKLYCECFAASVDCTAECSCAGCHNLDAHAALRDSARAATLIRNPTAFKPKINDSAAPSASAAAASAEHTRGCFCKKSGCLKKYCECFQARVACSAKCKCEGCKNYEGTDGYEGAHAARPRLLSDTDSLGARLASAAATVDADDERYDARFDARPLDSEPVRTAPRPASASLCAALDRTPAEQPTANAVAKRARRAERAEHAVGWLGGSPPTPLTMRPSDAVGPLAHLTPARAWSALRARQYVRCAPDATRWLDQSAAGDAGGGAGGLSALLATPLDGETDTDLSPGVVRVLVTSAPSCAERAALHALDSSLRFSELERRH